MNIDNFYYLIGGLGIVGLFFWLVGPKPGSSQSVEKLKLVDEPEEARKPRRDMPLSAGRDAGHHVNMAKEIHIPMVPTATADMLEFYLHLIGMIPMRPPNYPRVDNGFWAVKGSCRFYFGLYKLPEMETPDRPSIAVRDLDQIADRLKKAGHDIVWDTRQSYARRLGVVDPAGNVIALTGA